MIGFSTRFFFYFARICAVGYRNQSIKILFIDNANILGCGNNILLKSCLDIVYK